MRSSEIIPQKLISAGNRLLLPDRFKEKPRDATFYSSGKHRHAHNSGILFSVNHSELRADRVRATARANYTRVHDK